MKTIMVISDATGETAERMVRAAILQFQDTPINIRTYARVRLESEMEQVIERAVELHALLVYTVVNAEARDILLRLVEQYDVEAVDLMGALIGKLVSFLDTQPSGVPGLLHSLDNNYFQRMEAVEFAVKNDDGAEPRNLPKADMVLVGVSRTSKTPLSTYLAQRGLKVANVPLVLGVEPPPQLDQVDENRVYGLVIQPEILRRIRQERLKHMGMPGESSYGARDHIERELSYSRELFRAHPNWPVIDVTNKAIEETAADILRIYRQRIEGIG
ncbi:pyruvate, water dikinase regulatory protein [Haliangium ochraceum]|nr:pyruvate, water dikinase regulatory protein [Haliangium ochraceum]